MTELLARSSLKGGDTALWLWLIEASCSRTGAVLGFLRCIDVREGSACWILSLAATAAGREECLTTGVPVGPSCLPLLLASATACLARLEAVCCRRKGGEQAGAAGPLGPALPASALVGC